MKVQPLILGRMPQRRRITFVVAVKSQGEVLENNLLASPCFLAPHDHQILVQEGFQSAAKAYNDAIDRSVNDLIVFCHQDIFLPEAWLSDLERALSCLEADDPQWGVLGCFGETLNDRGRGHVYSSGNGIMGRPFERPTPIQTLDEIVLILRKSSGLRFDESLPHFHLYGTDICLRAAKKGMKNYAISAFCIHNTCQNLILAPEFYECYWHIRRVWRDSLPIHTTCMMITKSGFPMYRKKLQEAYLRYVRRKEIGGARVQNVRRLLEMQITESRKS
jgi:hypothetical protein